MQSSGIRKNLLYSIGYQILAVLLPLLTTPYIARCLGADQLGIYSKTQAIANYFYLFTLLGLNNYGNRAIARIRDDIHKTNKTFWEIYFGQILCAGIVSGIYLAFCYFSSLDNKHILLLQFLYVASGIIEVNWYCFGQEEFRLTMIRSTIVRLIVFVAIFVFVHSKKDLAVYTFIMASSYIVSNIIIWPYVLKHTNFVKPSFRSVMSHFKPNLVLFLPVIAVSLYNIMDKLIMTIYSSNEEVAFYASAETIVNIPVTLIIALNNVIMPRMSNIFAKNETEAANKLMNTVMLLAMFMASAMTFGLAGVSGVFAPWFYGLEFARCGLYIFMLCPTILFRGWAGALRTQYIIPSGKDRIYVISLISGAVVNLVLDILLIPRLSGVGAIIGTLAAEFTVAIIQFGMCRHNIPIGQYIKNGFAFVIAGIIMYFCVYYVGKTRLIVPLALLLQIITGIFVFSTLSFVYMTITKQTALINEGLKILRIRKRF